mmetsp:Transcript_87287/g.130970  ORF Transcript_87287/g.130970 Transcript_87287/m.130970 type:complete len:448 (-) Transcript_87287:48-1391(-)
MTVMTENRKVASSVASIPEHNTASRDSEDSVSNDQQQPPSRPLCTGLSALIQAATSQLGHLVDTDFGTSDASSQVSHHSSQHADGYASSSDGELLASTPTRNPTTEDANLSLPEVLMTLLINPEYSDIITFLPDGKFFAIRELEFSEQLMAGHFRVSSFDDFLELMESWGFARMSPENASGTGIQVFRHPHFRKGGSKDLRHVRFDQKQPDTAPTVIAEQARIEHSYSEDSGSSTTKRRLSPSHVTRDAEDQSLKQRAIEDTGVEHDRTPSSLGSGSHDPEPVRTVARRRSSTEARSYALAVTTAKLNLGGEDGEVSAIQAEHQPKASMPLEEGAVERVTQSIVTDAIESLLFDVGHTRETYMKHEKQLSTSAFPGIVPISKQLFSAQTQDEELQPNGATMPPCKDDSSKENAVASPSPTQIEAATALMKQAGKYDPPQPPFTKKTG